MAPTVVDFIGQPIKLGDTIVYPVRRRSDMSLKKAIVSEVPQPGGFRALKMDGRSVIIRVPERCIVINRLEKT